MAPLGWVASVDSRSSRWWELYNSVQMPSYNRPIVLGKRCSLTPFCAFMGFPFDTLACQVLFGCKSRLFSPMINCVLETLGNYFDGILNKDTTNVFVTQPYNATDPNSWAKWVLNTVVVTYFKDLIYRNVLLLWSLTLLIQWVIIWYWYQMDGGIKLSIFKPIQMKSWKGQGSRSNRQFQGENTTVIS